MVSVLGLGQVSPSALGIWTLVAGMFGILIKTWPIIKQKLNEARKIELDAHGGLRETLMGRIHELEENQSRDRTEFFKAMAEERQRCDEELEAIRVRLRQSEEHSQGLMSMIRQASSSAAMLVTNPDRTAITQAARRARGEEEQK